jgi:extracellular factor (EF) 3-hydroxypalmitic acid methyl ester biosynthesis protein
MDQHVAYAEKMVAQGGPRPEHYASFKRWLSIVSEELRTGKILEQDLPLLRDAFGRALSLDTLQGFSLLKPHGYPGDFEIIDRIYLEHISEDPAMGNWDRFFHAQSAPRAVRNRKTYFVRLLHALVDNCKDASIPVLNVASGPARDILEYFSTNGHDHRLSFECIDSDKQAVRYAQGLCQPYLDRIEFREVNALRFCTENRYKLIWSAGLFDYFEDKGFKFLLERFLPLLDEDGELVIGNFSRANSTRNYMEMLGDWYLCHRDEPALIKLAQDCGVAREDIRIGREQEGVNLFLHIKRGHEFIPM